MKERADRNKDMEDYGRKGKIRSKEENESEGREGRERVREGMMEVGKRAAHHYIRTCK